MGLVSKRGRRSVYMDEVREEGQTEVKGAEPSRRLGSQTYGGSGRGGKGLRKTPVSSTKRAKARPPASVPKI